MTGKIWKWLKNISHPVGLTVFLSLCKGCGNPLVLTGEVVVCRDCIMKIIRHTEPSCRICGRIIGDDREHCGECILKRPPFQQHFSFGRYRGLLKRLILMYKYGEIERLKHLLAGYYVRLYQEIGIDTAEGSISDSVSFDYLVTVPPDKSRNREFDHLYRLGRVLSERLELPLLARAMVKIKKTPPQAGLSKAKRLRNLDGAFEVENGLQLKGKKILLIDDVCTTGTTVSKCAALLKRHGAKVVVFTLARS